MKGSHVVLAVTFGLAGVACGQLVRSPNTTLDLPAALPSSSAYTTENALGSLTFAEPMSVASVTGETDRLFVAQRGGILKVVSNLSGTPAAADYLNLASLLTTGEALNSENENGFLAVVFHPDFVTNRTLFVYFSIRVSNDGNRYFQRLHRVVMGSATVNNPAIESHEALLTIYDRHTNHNGGSLGFGPEGYLYLSLGDEGDSGDSRNNAKFITQDPAVGRTGFWGQMLRLDVDRLEANLAPQAHQQNSTRFPSAVHAGAYKVPADNPFIGRTSWHNQTIDPEMVRTEIWATGLRNPFRWSFDKPTGRLFLGDVGQGAREEIDLITKGGDYGWSWREGNAVYAGGEPATGFNPIAPIFDYPRSSSLMLNGFCVTGGAVYRGSRLTELYGDYIFADYGSGAIAALKEESNGTWTARRLGDHDGIRGFGMDPRNSDLLFCAGNRVWRLVRSTVTGTAPPATLSGVGAFSDLTSLAPEEGIVPYEVNVPFWSDHAAKRRWFSIRNGTDQMTYNRDGNWTLPTGMVWIKHFDIETTRGDALTRKKLETRVLVKTPESVYGLSYRWREDQTDADLVAEEGMNDPLSINDGGSPVTQTWRFPSRGECLICHTTVGGHALSFNVRQLNREHAYGSQTLNQLTALQNAGYFSNTVSDVHTLPAFAAADDTTQSLEWRVRSYLAVNCSQCHQPGGPSTGNWDARATVELDSAQIINGNVIHSLGDAANRFVVPGDATHSVALKRLQGTPSRMPPVGSNVIDSAAVALITAWIGNELPARRSFNQWQVEFFGTPVPADAAADEDPDGDGISNMAEYLAGTSPMQGNPGPLEIRRENDRISFDFSLPGNRSMTLETSATLEPGSWVPWNVPGNSPHFPAAGGARTLEFPAPADERRFFRGRISSP